MVPIGSSDIMFGQDIVLDEEAFEKAAEDFENLSNKLKNLRADIESMLDDIKAGFDTPAGVKFINSCEKNLLEPLDNQKLVIDHIKETLRISKQQYESVFSEYSALQNTINSVNK